MTLCIRVFAFSCLGLCMAISEPAMSEPALGEPFGVPTYVPPQPSADRDDLADLAPPSSRSTAAETYGDAVFARRSRVAARGGRGPTARTAGRRPACLGATSDTHFKGCPGPASAFFQRKYVFTPSYVSAPQVYAQERGAPTPLLSPITGFFLDPVP